MLSVKSDDEFPGYEEAPNPLEPFFDGDPIPRDSTWRVPVRDRLTNGSGFLSIRR